MAAPALVSEGGKREQALSLDNVLTLYEVTYFDPVDGSEFTTYQIFLPEPENFVVVRMAVGLYVTQDGWELAGDPRTMKVARGRNDWGLTDAVKLGVLRKIAYYERPRPTHIEKVEDDEGDGE